MSIRAWLSGYEILNVPELHIYHRFRPRSEHDKFCTSIKELLLHNSLRFACYYLPDDLLAFTYEYYARVRPDIFRKCLAELAMTDVWARRAELCRELPLDFRWFAKKFALYRYLQKRHLPA
jgi:hypothetical protein